MSDATLSFGLLLLALVLFASGRIRHDLVAVTVLVVGILAGLVPGQSAFEGFGHPAVITVAAVLIISHALDQSGVVTTIARSLTRFTENRFMHIASLTLVVTVASAFMNNVGALALMLPVAMSTAMERERSPSILLMPLAFGSILGGMTTMIGTPPNVIIANYREQITGEPFGMFAFSPVGVAAAGLGVLFIVTFGWRLIPRARHLPAKPSELFEINDYVFELTVTEDSPLIGHIYSRIDHEAFEPLELLGRAKGDGQALAITARREVRAGDIMIVKATPDSVKESAKALNLELVTARGKILDQFEGEDLTLVEAVVPPLRGLQGRRLAVLLRALGRDVAALALARQGTAIRQRLRHQTLEPGDVLLLLMPRESVAEQISSVGLLPLAGRELPIRQAENVWLATGIFVAAITAGVVGIVSLPVAFVAAVLVYVLTGILPLHDLYRKIDMPVIILLAAMIPVGSALERSGATDLIAQSMLGLTGDFGPVVVLTLILIVTMFLSDIINNAATALVMAPIAVSISQTLNVNPDTFLMAVAIGASCAFLTPIGHQSNTLVMGPGGYRFTDYWRLGLPLEIIIVCVAVPVLLIVVPL